MSESDGAPTVELKHSRIQVCVRPGAGEEKKRIVVEEWYREQLKGAVPALIAKWESRLGVGVARFYVRKMKTKWGSCNPKSRTIRLNTDLAKKPPRCLEYLILHEMIHLLEPTHNNRFVALMNQFMPHWQFHRAELNKLPVRHEDWNCR